ncbi:hypothetical protein EIP91_008907 [Steccherinum ochraceum]|uniref:Transmembrane protein 135 N-terminal domain-containing protein n=1 Tax=Steccherinum ochraceum TaxID=92696 RepID=A0A4R0RU62_9APHY|nr:hypothetical protein EIP91_008907 [Steccherinum ochraceum]
MIERISSSGRHVIVESAATSACAQLGKLHLCAYSKDVLCLPLAIGLVLVSNRGLPNATCDMPPPFPAVTQSTHPAQIAARTYALSLSLSLAPALVPFVISAKARAGGIKALARVLKRELGLNGFAFAMTVGVGGGSALQQLWKWLEVHYSEAQISSDGGTSNSRGHSEHLRRALAYTATLPDGAKAFVANTVSAALAISLLQGRSNRNSVRKASLPMTVPMQDSSTTNGGRASPTLDLTLLLFVRAMDSVLHATVLPIMPKPLDPEKEGDLEKHKIEANACTRKRRTWTSRVDAFVFWASSARIMWCFFYAPERLPRSYNKWIMSIANIDPRILAALRSIRTGAISYRTGQATPVDLLSSLSTDLGYPAAWGDVSRIPAYGGPKATAAWSSLGVTSRNGLGGIPCELVHGGVTGSSCTSNAVIRGIHAFAEAAAIYLPVHVLPILLTNPQKLLQIRNLWTTSLSVMRSSAFLSTFVSSIWMSVCLTRTLLLARLFPGISHDFWDGPLGCTYAGSLMCGASIWIEQGKRRGEMALYVLPRALRACLSESWIKSGKRSFKIVERLVFIWSLATLLTAAIHRTDALRGLSRWTLAYIMRGPNISHLIQNAKKVAPPPDDTPASAKES